MQNTVAQEDQRQSGQMCLIITLRQKLLTGNNTLFWRSHSSRRCFLPTGQTSKPFSLTFRTHQEVPRWRNNIDLFFLRWTRGDLSPRQAYTRLNCRFPPTFGANARDACPNISIAVSMKFVDSTRHFHDEAIKFPFRHVTRPFLKHEEIIPWFQPHTSDSKPRQLHCSSNN